MSKKVPSPNSERQSDEERSSSPSTTEQDVPEQNKSQDTSIVATVEEDMMVKIASRSASMRSRQAAASRRTSSMTSKSSKSQTPSRTSSMGSKYQQQRRQAAAETKGQPGKEPTRLDSNSTHQSRVPSVVEDADYRHRMSTYWTYEFDGQEPSGHLSADQDTFEENEEGNTRTSSSSHRMGDLEEDEASIEEEDEPQEEVWRPGAYALSGMGSSHRATERRHTLESDVLGLASELTFGTPNAEIGRRQSKDSTDTPIPELLPSSMTKAKMISDAEPVFVAEDVKYDNRKRLLFVGGLLIACVVAAITTAVLVQRSRNDETPCLLDEVCCKPVESMNVFERCSCFDDTFSAYDELTDTGVEIYDYQLEFYRTSDFWMNLTDDDVDPYSCDAFNQILIHYGAEDGFGFTLEQLEEVSYDVISSITALTWGYVALDGPLWTRNDLWGTSEVLCEWYGVGCLFLDIRHELKLSNNGLRGAIPKALTWVPELRNIDLSQNQINGTIPTQFGFMSQLTSLQLSDLELTGQIPAELGDLSRLGILDLEENDLTGSIPPSIFEMPSLREFEVSHNAISGSFPTNTTYTASQLAIFRANHNQLTGTLPDELENLSRLELLNLEQNSLSGPIPDFLGRMPNLQFVNLYESGLTGSIPETFCERPEGSGVVQIIVNCRVVATSCSCCSSISEEETRVLVQCGEEVPEIIAPTER